MEDTFTDNSLTLKSVQQQFEAWRATRSSRREPIPESLWQAAAELCASHSVNKVCRHLHLSHARLKKRVCKENKPRTDFIELDLHTLAGQWKIECSRADGARLQIAGGGQSPQISSILEAFLS
jgi:hypothetical protein